MLKKEFKQILKSFHANQIQIDQTNVYASGERILLSPISVSETSDSNEESYRPKVLPTNDLAGGRSTMPDDKVKLNLMKMGEDKLLKNPESFVNTKSNLRSIIKEKRGGERQLSDSYAKY